MKPAMSFQRSAGMAQPPLVEHPRPTKPGSKSISKVKPATKVGWTWPLMFSAVAVVLFASMPDVVCHASFFAEDGKFFFKPQYELGLSAALLTHYAGYLHFAPRILASFCELFPLEYEPTAYAVVSLLVAAAVLTFFAAPGFRSVISSDSLRVVVVAAFTVMPNAESLMKLAYVNWYMVVFLALTTLYTLPTQTWALWLLFVPAAIAAWTNPVAIVCAPVMLLRAWKATRMERVWWLALALVVIGYSFTEQVPPTGIKLFLHQTGWSLALFRALGYRVLCFFFLSDTVSFPRPGEGWGMMLAVASVLVVACIVGTAWAVAKTKIKWMPLAVVYLILGTSAMFVLRPENWHLFLDWNIRSWDANGRYFYCSTLLLCVLCGMIYERILLKWTTANIQRSKMAVCLLLAWLNLHEIGAKMFEWKSPAPWETTAREIRAAEARVRQTGNTETVRVQTSIYSFDFDLTVNPANARRDGLIHL